MTHILYPPHSICYYKLKKLYETNTISVFTKYRILWKQLMFLNFLLISNILWFLDEIFFPSYHKVQIKKPVFLLGGFRSGTTIIHRSVVKENDNFISPRFVELLLPFMIVQYFFDFFEWSDRKWNTKFISFFDSVLYLFFGKDIMKKHFINFLSPEEDDILLSLFYGIGWYNIVQFPLFDSWSVVGNMKLNKFDLDRIQTFYHCCMQKVLYRRGKTKQLVNKSHLVSMYPIWKNQYPDSIFIGIDRRSMDAFYSWIELNRFTNKRFFNLDYFYTYYMENHSLHWKQFEKQKEKIKFDKEVTLEDFCKNKEKVIQLILEEINKS